MKPKNLQVVKILLLLISLFFASISYCLSSPKAEDSNGNKNEEKELINLIDKNNIDLNIVSGKWLKTKNSLITSGKKGHVPAALRLPYIPPRKYELFIEFTAAKSDTISTTFMVGAKQTTFFINSYGNLQGFGHEKGKKMDRPAQGKRTHTLLIQTDGKRVVIFLDGKKVSDRDSIYKLQETSAVGFLQIKTHVRDEVVFHSIKIKDRTKK